MLQTTNFKFNKLELTDSPPDITVLNKNWDTIDEELNKKFNKTGGNITGEVNLNSNSLKNANSIELMPASTANHGGFIDFHYNGSSADYTSRIIEESEGQLSINATNGAKFNGTILTSRSSEEAIRNINEGGRIFLFNPDDTTYKGGVLARTKDNNNNQVDLLARADGLLQWNNKNIVRSVNGLEADTSGNVSITVNGVSPDESGDIKVTGTEIGSYIFHAGNVTPAGYLLCNGALVSRTTYAALFAAIGTTYGTGDGSTTFALPNLTDKFLQGSQTAGTVKAAGLPNATGTLSIIACQSVGASGSFSRTSYSAGMDGMGGGGYYKGGPGTSSISMSLKNSNSIYGASSTVQPPALTARIYIKY